MKNNNENIDFEIIERIKEGDTSEFRVLVEKYKDVSFSLACSILHDEHEAEDALQEAFIKVYKNLKKFQGKSSFATWLYRIIVNTCFTIAKKQEKRKLQDNIDYYYDLEIPNDRTGLQDLVDSERTAIIKKVLKTMKTDEALLLRLFYLSELDVREIMKVTGFNESKIKVTLHRARKNVLTEMQRIFGKELILLK